MNNSIRETFATEGAVSCTAMEVLTRSRGLSEVVEDMVKRTGERDIVAERYEIAGRELKTIKHMLDKKQAQLSMKETKLRIKEKEVIFKEQTLMERTSAWMNVVFEGKKKEFETKAAATTRRLKGLQDTIKAKMAQFKCSK